MIKRKNSTQTLLMVNPKLSEEWDYDKNVPLEPKDVSIGSHQKVWWKCTKGHEWQAVIKDRHNGNGCPICANKLVVTGINDLATTHPRLAIEWDLTKNKPLLPTQISFGSGKKVWWKCEHGHEWKARIADRSNGSECPVCLGRKAVASINDLATTSPELVREWNYERNGELQPSELTSGSHIKVWWKCSLGHEWETSPNQRARGRGCPYCSNNLVLVGFNDLLTTNPSLSKEWNYEKNIELRPEQFSCGSHKLVWWRCADGHEWKAEIKSRAQGNGCPVCSNRVVVAGVNDLQTTHPELAAEWNYERNYPFLPSQLTHGSAKKVWWKCEFGHEWKTDPNSRVSGNTVCPYCSSNGSSKPEQGIAFYLSKCCDIQQRCILHNKEVDVYLSQYKIGVEYDGIFYHKDKKTKDIQKNEVMSKAGVTLLRVIESDKNYLDNHNIYYKHDNMGSNYVWAVNTLLYLISDLTHNDSFKAISVDTKRDSVEIRQRFALIMRKNNLAVKNPELAKEWNYEKNGNLKPEMFLCGSNEKVWWKCSKGHAWTASINTRNDGRGCPYCNNRIVLQGYNDLETINPKLAKEWNYEKNNSLLPSQVLAFSNRRVWWKCIKGHEWEINISSRLSGHGCPYCSGRLVIKGEKDLETLSPNIAKEWNYAKNLNLAPADVSLHSNKKVWWKCRFGHEWKASVEDRTYGRGCPYCSNKRVLVGYNNLFHTNPDLKNEWNYVKNKGLDPDKFMSGSHKKVWWKCSNNHEWEATIQDRTYGMGCPYCSGRYAIKGETDLATVRPDLAAEWDYDKNTILTPDSVKTGSNIKVWWKCKNCGYSWQSYIYSRTSSNSGCPKCANKARSLSKSKPVICIETNIMYSCLTEAEKLTGVNKLSISNCCRGKQKTAGGYHWKFYKF